MTDLPENFEERFAELWTDYLEGELDESGLVELQELLAAHDFLLKRASDYYRTHRLLGLIATEQSECDERFISDLMQRLPEDSESFSRGVMQRVALQHSVQENGNSSGADSGEKARRYRSSMVSRSGWVVALFLSIALPVVWYAANRVEVAEVSIEKTTEEQPAGNVQFASLSHARFLGEMSPAINSVIPLKREYVLLGGLVELAFPRGASAIVEGPAVFRVLSDESLALDVGHCSVHAPEGAEGFRVDTPVTRVVDRGTRFCVNVSETSETEVQVIEGMADLYRYSDRSEKASAESPDASTFERRLSEHEACLLENGQQVVAKPTAYNSAGYRSRLQDRIVSYQATTAQQGGAEFLESVVVQRGGKVIEYSIDQIIPVELIYFKANPGVNANGHIAAGESLSESRIQVLSDRALNTGIINPGGSAKPLVDDPVMRSEGREDRSCTPGMAVRFREPVANGPGPDVVFFELQTVSNPPEGDAFHVSPLVFGSARRSHTIRFYDLTMLSSEAEKISRFHLYRFHQNIASLEELETVRYERKPSHQRLRFRAIAVGIDFSDLGYAPGEQVEGLFIQDARDDQSMVDPVFIGGLP